MGSRTTVEQWRTDLRAALTAAMKRRDKVATAAARAALAAIDNAEASDAAAAPEAESGSIAGGVHGLGRGEVDRRSLSIDEVEAIVRREIAERRAAAVEYRRAGVPERADLLDAEADVLVAWSAAAQGLDDVPAHPVS